MADAKAPVAIRIVRPYASPEEFVRHDLESLTKTSITLAGAQPRPKGVVLRFEVTLAGGKAVMRGEGRVLGYSDAAGLTLRFTRLDPKSKALVDWAAAIKDARARGLPDPAPPELPSGKLPGERPSDPDLAKALPPPPPPKKPTVPPVSLTPIPQTARSAPPPADPASPPRAPASSPPSTQQAPPSGPPSTQQAAPSVPGLDDGPTATSLPESRPQPTASLEDIPTIATTRDAPEPPDLAGLSAMREAVRIAPPKIERGERGERAVEAPANKSELLGRLRERARAMPQEKIEQILEKRAR